MKTMNTFCDRNNVYGFGVFTVNLWKIESESISIYRFYPWQITAYSETNIS